MSLTEPLPTPDVFRLWTALSLVGAALERRCWVETSGIITYPNLFVLLVARPGVGKSHAIKVAHNLSAASGNIRTSPEDLTKQALLDYLISEDVRKRLAPGKPGSPLAAKGPFFEYHSLAMFISEFGTMFRSQDQEMLATLCTLFDSVDEYAEKRRYRGKTQPSIPHPQVSILAGTATAYLSTIFPPEAWSQGFMSRVIMVYSGEAKKVPLFKKIPEERLKKEAKLKADLIRDLAQFEAMSGEFTFDDEAAEALETWYDLGLVPVPTAPRLVNYNTRRIVHIQKLCMIACASRTDSKIINIRDLQQAKKWLLDTEEAMPNVFLEMTSSGDGDIIRQFHHWAYAEYHKGGKKSMHKSKLMAWLSTRCESWRAPKILEMALASHVFKTEAGNPDYYIPQPWAQWGQGQ